MHHYILCVHSWYASDELSDLSSVALISVPLQHIDHILPNNGWCQLVYDAGSGIWIKTATALSELKQCTSKWPRASSCANKPFYSALAPGSSSDVKRNICPWKILEWLKRRSTFTNKLSNTFLQPLLFFIRPRLTCHWSVTNKTSQVPYISQ